MRNTYVDVENGRLFKIFWNGKEIEDVRDFSCSYKQSEDQKSEETTDATTGKKKEPDPPRGKELKELEFSVQYVSTIMGDQLREQIRSWEARLTFVDDLYLHGEKFGPPWQLREVKVGDVLFNDSGEIMKCKVTVKFKEYEESTSSVKMINSFTAFPFGPDGAKKAMAMQDEPPPAEVPTKVKVGDYVKVLGSKYVNPDGSQTIAIPDFVKNTTHPISKIDEPNNKVLLGSINSWVRLDEVSL